MCSNWIVNGVYCSIGSDLVRAIGRDAARRVNRAYSDAGDTVPEARIDECCLCPVDEDALAAETGSTYAYDAGEDAFVPAPIPMRVKGDAT